LIVVIGAVVALALLTCCVSYIEQKGPAKGTVYPVTLALNEEYIAFVGSEHDEYDGGGADYFARKGLAAAGGQVVEPEDPAKYDLADAASEITAARARLMTDLNGGGRGAKPAGGAKGQGEVECWGDWQGEGVPEGEDGALKE